MSEQCAINNMKIDNNKKDIDSLWKAIRELKDTVSLALHGDNQAPGVITMSRESYDYVQKKLANRDDLLQKITLMIIAILVGYVAWKLNLRP